MSRRCQRPICNRIWRCLDHVTIIARPWQAKPNLTEPTARDKHSSLIASAAEWYFWAYNRGKSLLVFELPLWGYTITILTQLVGNQGQ